MITRKLGKLLRGNATPFQIVAACVLGTMLGFAPPIAQGPALYALILAVLLVTNANLGLALLTAGGARLLALLIAPLSFQVGRFLLDGPTSEVARAVVNTPVLAWCGLHYYGVAGGLLIALVLGPVAGLMISRSVTSFRRRMAAAAESPSRWSELAAKPWARAAIWLFFGKQAKGTWEDRLGKRVGNPIRIWGAALVVLGLAGFYFAQRPLASALARRGLQTGLERANGATVDLGGVELDLRQGQLGVSALALADPGALERDLFRAERLAADIDQVDFLRRRVHLASVVVKEAASGTPRAQAGERLAPEAETSGEEAGPPLGDGDHSIEELFEEYETWKERLGQARSWLDRLAGEDVAELEGEALAEYLARQVREGGWLSVGADHLVTEAPTFRLSELVVEGFALAWMPDQTFDLRGSELSSHPWLVDGPPRLELASRDDSIRFEVDLAPASRAGGEGALKVAWKGLSLDSALAMLRLPGPPPLSGGTLDLEIDGTWADGRIGWVDLPLKVTLHDTTLTMQGIDPTPLDELVLPIGITGPIDGPRIHFDAATFTDALTEAGKRELANQLQGRLEEELGDQLQEAGIELPGDLGEEVDEQAKGLLKGVLGQRP